MPATDLFGRTIPEKAKPVITAARVGRTRLTSEINTVVERGDCLEVLGRMAADGAAFDACVTDPPYHLTITNRFGVRNAKSAKTAVHRRFARGFMGQSWDGGDVAMRPETWAAVASTLRPGAFLLSFGGTRTFHRLACAIEDGGFALQDTIAWMYGSGFPKRRDMLKPAWEPIILAYKPGGERTLQIDECRVPISGEVIDPKRIVNRMLRSRRHPGWDRPGARNSATVAKRFLGVKKTEMLGRWPANVCHDGSDEVTELFPDCASGPPRDLSGFRTRRSGYGLSGGQGGYSDDGSAARFFYVAKPDTDERAGSGHPTVKPVALMRWLVRLVVPEGGTVIDPFAGTGTTGVAAMLEGVDSVLIEREPQYVEDIQRKIMKYKNRRVRTLY